MRFRSRSCKAVATVARPAEQAAARALALKLADSERAQKQRESDARVNVNASKWRYICQEG
ncbi:hypothetical protein DIE22_34435 [Burkholderia sp. Bp9142]|nr:hypothetical protein DIE22_34435 [Burkholderia sp. Bp9142]